MCAHKVFAKIHLDGADFYEPEGVMLDEITCVIYGDPELVQVEVCGHMETVEIGAINEFLEDEGKDERLSYRDAIAGVLNDHGFDVEFMEGSL
jgi:hypothetical protein